MKVGVYSFNNLDNGKRYIGSSNDLDSRWNKHLAELRDGRHYNIHLQRAWFEYGECNFEIEWLEDCKGLSDKEILDTEDHWIEHFNSIERGYNMRGAIKPIISEETRKKMSLAKKGKKLSSTTKARMSLARMGEKNPQYGKVRSKETLKRMSDAQSGEKHPMWGKKHKESTLQKMRENSFWRGKTFHWKLSDEDVEEIKDMLKEGSLTQTEIGQEFNVGRKTISIIAKRANIVCANRRRKEACFL